MPDSHSETLLSFLDTVNAVHSWLGGFNVIKKWLKHAHATRAVFAIIISFCCSSFFQSSRRTWWAWRNKRRASLEEVWTAAPRPLNYSTFITYFLQQKKKSKTISCTHLLICKSSTLHLFCFFYIFKDAANELLPWNLDVTFAVSNNLFEQAISTTRNGNVVELFNG